jgi:hypothetical protein
MKKLFVCLLTAGLLLSSVGCATPSGGGSSVSSGGSVSTPRPKTKLGGVPDFVNEAYMNASEDVLIGIGTYKTGGDPSKIGAGKTFAETRARADISRQLQTLVKNMVTDYTATSELDPSASLSFQEEITQTLSRSDLKGSRTIQMQMDDNGLLWVVMEYSKSAAQAEVDQAANAAKLKVPQAAAFNALDRMDAAFSKEAGGGPIPVNE